MTESEPIRANLANRKAGKGSKGGQPGVAGTHAVVAFVFEVIQKRQDNFWSEIVE